MLLTALLSMLLTFHPQGGSRDVWILSTGGCIIDPRPKPTQLGGTIAGKSSASDEEVLVTYFQDREKPQSDVIWRFQYKKGDPLRLYPYRPDEGNAGQYIDLTGVDKEDVRLSHDEADDTCLLVRYVNGVAQTGEHDKINTGYVWNSFSKTIAPKSGKASQPAPNRALIELSVFGKKTGFAVEGNNLNTLPLWLNPDGDPTDYRLLTLRPSPSGYAVRAGVSPPINMTTYEKTEEMAQVVRYSWVDSGPMRTITYELEVMKGDVYYLGLPQRRTALAGAQSELREGKNKIVIVANSQTKTWSIALNDVFLRQRIPFSWAQFGAPQAGRVGASWKVDEGVSISVDLLGLPALSPMGFTLHAKTISDWPHWVEHKKKSEETTGPFQLLPN